MSILLNNHSLPEFWSWLIMTVDDQRDQVANDIFEVDVVSLMLVLYPKHVLVPEYLAWSQRIVLTPHTELLSCLSLQRVSKTCESIIGTQRVKAEPD